MGYRILPPSTPRLTLASVEPILEAHREWILPADKVCVVGVRGYYRDTMGAPGRNDRGIYDDAIFIASPTHFSAWNANTDPSVFRPKTAAKPGIATLKLGVHRYKRGLHGVSRGNPYPAFIPAAPGKVVPVLRDGDDRANLTGVALNIHRGGVNGTSSEGCQTIPPHLWDAFYTALDAELARHKQNTFPYVLTAVQ